MVTNFRWNECIKFPIKIKELPLNSILYFTIWDICSIEGDRYLIGSGNLKLFSDDLYL